MSRPVHFAVPVGDRWLVHFPLHGTTALMDHLALKELVSGGAYDAFSGDALAALRSDLLNPPSNSVKPKEGIFDPEYLALVTTRSCNINCVYCDFGGPTSKGRHMEPPTASGAIDWMAQHLVSRGRDLFVLHFFGGEPLVAGKVVEFAVQRLREVSEANKLRSYVDISTNGVMSDARLKWLGESVDSVILSFDGPPEFQNRNRPAANGRQTFEAVDRTARHLSSSGVELCLRACVTRESVHDMPEMTRWMIETYRPAIINFEPLTENDLTAASGLEAAGPVDYARAWIKSRRLANGHGVRLVYSATEADGPRLSSCPVGSDTMIVMPDGTVNGCYLQPGDWLKRGMDMSLGRLMPDRGLQINAGQVHHLRHMVMEKPRCRNCLCQWSCAGGCHVSNTYLHCPESYGDYCRQTRIIAACLLLEELGEHSLADELLADDEALARLADHPADVIGPQTRPSGGSVRPDAALCS